MSETEQQFILETIEAGVVEHGGDLDGWTKLDDGCLKIFDGRVSLSVNIMEAELPIPNIVHAHVLATLHEHDDEVLDACLMGMAEDRDSAMRQVAGLWIMGVAGPIISFIENKPICMTCQAGVQDGDASQGYVVGDYGLPGLRAFVGPAFNRGIEDDDVMHQMNETKPWFRDAAESAAPRRVHLAKATVQADGDAGWLRQLEIDGHEVSHQDPGWPAGVKAPKAGYITRYAVFEFPRNSSQIAQRKKLDDAIRFFATNLSKCDSVDELSNQMAAQGFEAEMVHEILNISTMAFGRAFFSHTPINYDPTIVRARSDGRIEENVRLISLPAYSRAFALYTEISEQLSEDDLQSLCFYSAESNAILQMLESAGEDCDLSEVSLMPSMVPDHGASEQTIDQALAMMQQDWERDRAATKKPWWKFW